MTAKGQYRDIFGHKKRASTWDALYHKEGMWLNTASPYLYTILFICLSDISIRSAIDSYVHPCRNLSFKIFLYLWFKHHSSINFSNSERDMSLGSFIIFSFSCAELSGNHSHDKRYRPSYLNYLS